MTSQQLFEQAQRLIPGGVNSPVRAFHGVGGTPLFIDHAHGAYIVDCEQNSYIDYVGSWGPMITGHAHPAIVKATQQAITKGLSYGAPTAIETRLAAKIIELMPTIEQIRMVNSGTEATLSAIRLARGFTAKNKIIKFNGCYHGHSDGLLVKAGSGVLTLGIPGSPGVPKSVTQHTLSAEFNNLSQVEQLFEKYHDDIACIIVEPVPGNMNLILPQTEFLTGLRKLCDHYHAILIFDEVMSGFRVARGGAQAIYNIKPDLTTLGKVIGGGMPVGAFGGKREIMQHLAPAGPVYQAGTLSGNPIAMTAGLTQLELLSAPGFYEQLSDHTQQLINGLQKRADAAGINLSTCFLGSQFGFVFTDQPHMQTFNDVASANIEQFKQFFHGMLKQGVYFAPSAFETGFVSSAHNDDTLQQTLNAAEAVFAQMKKTSI